MTWALYASGTEKLLERLFIFKNVIPTGGWGGTHGEKLDREGSILRGVFILHFAFLYFLYCTLKITEKVQEHGLGWKGFLTSTLLLLFFLPELSTA